MNKDFDKWNILKQQLNESQINFHFRERDIFFISIGKNIGFEQDGKGKNFFRPVLVYKKFNKYVFLGIPLTSKIKKDRFHFEFEYKKGTKSFAILSQIRLFDIRRANYYDGKIAKKYFHQLQKKLLDLIVTPLQEQRVCTKAICENIILQKKLNVKGNILVTGANGQLGSELQSLSQNYNYNFYFTDRYELDITDKSKIEEFVNKNNIKIIINCAAYTAVDKAETEKGFADLVNHKAVQYLAEISKQNDIILIHISTDYVFDGKNYKPYKEDDKTNPQGIYGLTKLKGEEAFINSGARGIIIRTSWVYSSFGNNFVKTMLRLSKERDELGVIYDQIGTPTYARDLALALLKIMNYELGVMNEESEENKIIHNSKLITQNSVSIYHYSNEGVCSWYDFAKAIFEIKNIDIKINPIETKEYPTPAKRPYYSVLNKSKIKEEFGIIVPYWKDSLRECIAKIMSDEF